MEQRCTVCHSADRVTSAQKTAAQWKQTVDKMINNGAQLSPSEEQTLVNYLAQTYHP
jgi:cytochrome c-type biogenesis protein CcmH/NrfF